MFSLNIMALYIREPCLKTLRPPATCQICKQTWDTYMTTSHTCHQHTDNCRKWV